MAGGRWMSDRRDGGTAVLFVALATAGCGLVGVGMVDAVGVVHARQRAQLAADAAALAAVHAGRSAADRLAAANGAVLVEHRLVDGEVVVQVEIRVTGMVGERTVRATARASDLP